eukprot:TRINITY_DN704_c0_g4_i1.p1 TRINITY_DN704_c0_g4~~TRINITY_DN704_c0_g4_i1.p1  ORF type:complete len:184 (-),score=18.21 TRINITY_DN704_c0_g4_i1:793-1344(-)
MCEGGAWDEYGTVHRMFPPPLHPPKGTVAGRPVAPVTPIPHRREPPLRVGASPQRLASTTELLTELDASPLSAGRAPTSCRRALDPRDAELPPGVLLLGSLPLDVVSTGRLRPVAVGVVVRDDKRVRHRLPVLELARRRRCGRHGRHAGPQALDPEGPQPARGAHQVLADVRRVHAGRGRGHA